MTADILLVLLLTGAAALTAAGSALILAAFGPTGWFVILALGISAALVWRLAAAQLAARARSWTRDDLADDWRPG
jgi:mannitol-specific phosphotransferase system IIBC component